MITLIPGRNTLEKVYTFLAKRKIHEHRYYFTAVNVRRLYAHCSVNARALSFAQLFFKNVLCIPVRMQQVNRESVSHR